MTMQPVSCTRIIGNKYNRVLGASIAASAQRASSQILLLSQQRAGNGGMALSGPYTGASDSVIDVEVLSGSAGALRASTPIVNGVGNGTLAVQSIDSGAANQTLTFTLLDSGTSPVPAILDFFGVQLAARAVGALGNAVHLSVVRNLVFTDMQYATLEKLTTGSNVFDGPQYDWGQPAATGPDIPEGALRMAFAGLPTVHRTWKTWDKGRFLYRIDPPLAYDVPENTRLREVSGDYTLTLADGTSTEVYTAVTMYDFLAQVQARSALCQVLGVVAQDRAPGGQAVTDIPLRTDAHALPVIGPAPKGGATLVPGAVDIGAATENITVTCLANTSSAGAQAWSVSGGVSGTLPAAYTGVPYTAGPVDFVIGSPVVAVALGAAITGRYKPTTRETGEGLPAICFNPLLLGTAATDKEVTFEYKQRPPDECSCSNARPLKVNLQCLGLDPEGGDAMDVEFQTRLIDLYQWQAGFVASNLALIGFDPEDVDTAVSCTGILAEALAEIYDVPAAATAWDGVFTQLQAELAPYANLGAQWGLTGGVDNAPADAWAPRKMRVTGEYLHPLNGHKYTITGITIDGDAVFGTPADAVLPLPNKPLWEVDGSSFTVTELTDVVVTVTDMGLVKPWGQFQTGRVFDSHLDASNPANRKVRITAILVGGVSAAMPTYAITWTKSAFDADSGTLTGAQTASPYATVEIFSESLGALPVGADVMLGQEIVHPLNHHCYRVDVIKVATVAAPAAAFRFPADADAVWATGGTFDLTMPAPADGRAAMIVSVTDSGLAISAAASGKTMGQGAPQHILDVTVTPYPKRPTPEPGREDWYDYVYAYYLVEFANQQAEAAADRERLRLELADNKVRFTKFMEYFPQKYEARMDWVRTVAGIPPKTDASGAGSPCWHDHGDPFWWVDTDGFYLPAFTGKPYVSAKRDANGKPVSTYEFGFGLITECGHRLKEGDQITIKITGSHNASSWSEGDRFVIPLIAAASAPLVGGADGDPTQTWTVRSTVLGALADWAWLPSAPTSWAHAPATVDLLPGGIAFEVGDVVAFDIEGGALRWRRDGGAWTTADIYNGAISLGDGLALQATPGAAPSFLGGDVWQYSAVATYGTARLRQPRIGQAFAWDGAACTLDVDLGSVQDVECVLLAMHTLASTASVTISAGIATPTEVSMTPVVRAGVILATLPHLEGDPPEQARYLRVTITGAGAGGAIGWLWAGMGWQPTVGPSRMTLKRQYGLARGAGINPAALYRGAGTGGSWAWDLDSGAALLAGNAQGLLELIDHSAEQGLEPLALIPDIDNAQDASVALIDADEITMQEFGNWQNSAVRVVSLELPLRAVLA